MNRKWGLWFSSLLMVMLPALAKDSHELHLASFQTVWETIRDKHWDLKGTGVDWQEVYKKYKPKAEAAKTRSEMRQVIQAMIGELGQSHFNIFGESTSSAVAEVETLVSSGNARPGFQVDVVDNRVFIATMEPSGAATEAGLQIGDEILQVHKKDMKTLLSKTLAAYEEMSHAQLHIKRTLNRFFHGYSGEKIQLKLSRKGKTFKQDITLSKPKGQYLELLNLPPTYFQYDSYTLKDNIGYVAFNIWVPQAKMAFENQSLAKMKDTQGLIIDLRGNGGGLGILAVSLANKLVSEKGHKLGTMRNSGTAMNFPIFPQKPVYTAPVAILVDEGSASTSEIFAAGLQEMGRARVFGVTSAGATLPSLIEILPNGDLFQYAMADYTSASGRKIEGEGVIPDQKTPHTLESLSKGQDATLEAARQWIQKQSSQGDIHE